MELKQTPEGKQPPMRAPIATQVLAVLLATFLTIFSLSIHIAARPFEDTGTDWTEMLSLWAQLITLVAGPVFVILVRHRLKLFV